MKWNGEERVEIVTVQQAPLFDKRWRDYGKDSRSVVGCKRETGSPSRRTLTSWGGVRSPFLNEPCQRIISM